MNMNINNKQLVQIGITVAILVILIVFISSTAKAIKRLFGFDNDTTVYQDTPLITSEDMPIGFDPTPMVTRLKEVHQWMFDASPRCDAYKALMGLRSNEFIMVCNEYYKNGGDTLRSDMDATFQSGCSFFFTKWDKKVRKRMDSLNIIS